MASFDFTEVLNRIGATFTKRFRRVIETQIDLDGRAFSPPAPSTLKARARLMQGTTSQKKLAGQKANKTVAGKTLAGTARTKWNQRVKSIPLTRVYVTHDLALRGFRHTAFPSMLRVFVQDVAHKPFYGKNPLLSDIVRWNSKGQPSLNPRVGVKAPNLFPASDLDVPKIQPEWGMAKDMFEREAVKQAREKFTLFVRTELRV